MNIVYISNLSNSISAGPNWSVPASIKAQQKYDNVFWVECTNAYQKHWSEVEAYHNIKEFRTPFRISNLPYPFCQPDIIVFEGFYHQLGLKIAKEARKYNIPYIIVPRGSLTYQAQNNHSWMKKKIANFLYYKSFCNNALAIQYLTQTEYKDSGNAWCKNHIILPNGFSTPSITKQSFSSEGIKAVFIGRKDIYHKGLDLLLEAINKNKELLLKSCFKLYIYGPEKHDHSKITNIIQEKDLSGIVENFSEIGGKTKEITLLDSDIFVLTSRFEGHPMGLIEALAYGLPALVSVGSNMSEEINNADAGWICNTDVDSLENALRKIISEKHLFVNKSKNAIVLSANYDWDKLADRFHHQLMNLISREK